MHIVEFFFSAVWVAFWLYWLLAAVVARGAQVWSSQSLLVRIAVAAIVVIAVRTPILKGRNATLVNPWLQGLGVAIFLLGLALAVRARIYLGKSWGMPMSEKVSPQLITTGPYRYVRHPIYSGLMLAGIGTALALNLWGLVVVALVGAYFVYSATVEERTMTQRFPTEYPPYKRSTKMLIPHLI